jgi:hypothetical protein
MKALVAVAVILFTSIVGNAAEQPDRFPVAARFVPIDDSSYRVVILTQDSSSPAPKGYLPKYCGEGWNVGFIQAEFKDNSKAGALVTNPSGCWAASGSNPHKDTITFRYLSISTGTVREFTIEPSRMRRMLYEWRTERLFPFPKT